MIRYAPTPKNPNKRGIPRVGPRPGQGESARFSTRPGTPNPGAGTQAYLGQVTAKGRRAQGTGDARSALDPLAGAKGHAYVQRDPEGGIREVHVYNVNGRRQVRAFTRTKPLPPAVEAALKAKPRSMSAQTGRGALSAHAAGTAPSPAAVRAAQRMLDKQPTPRSGSKSKNSRRRLYEKAIRG